MGIAITANHVSADHETLVNDTRVRAISNTSVIDDTMQAIQLQHWPATGLLLKRGFSSTFIRAGRSSRVAAPETSSMAASKAPTVL